MTSGSEWNKKGATLSDKTAKKEFDLTQDEIIAAIKTGKLQYKQNHIHGNPYLRLLRKEVESFVKEKYGKNFFEDKSKENEIAEIDKEIRALKKRLKILEEKKAGLLRET